MRRMMMCRRGVVFTDLRASVLSKSPLSQWEICAPAHDGILHQRRLHWPLRLASDTSEHRRQYPQQSSLAQTAKSQLIISSVGSTIQAKLTTTMEIEMCRTPVRIGRLGAIGANLDRSVSLNLHLKVHFFTLIFEARLGRHSKRYAISRRIASNLLDRSLVL